MWYADSSDDDFVGPSLELAAPADAQYDAAEEFAARNRSWEAEKKRAERRKGLRYFIDRSLIY